MPTEFDNLLEQAISAFEKQFTLEARRFGNKHAPIKGASDNAQGVQWNIAVIRDTNEIRLGVNLEGVAYQNWPITTLIQNELAASQLIETFVGIRQPEQIIVNFWRDAWQMASRPKIEEQYLAYSGSYLHKLTPEQWQEMLSEALTCLDQERKYRGRVKQIVTKTTGKAEMEVTPHLNMHTFLTYKQSNIETALAEAYQNLKPIYEWVKRQAC
jgi:hypothetical protein